MSKPRIRVVSAAICQEGRYLVTQRQAGAVLPLLWEFPGGRVEEGETDETALHRELRYRLGIDGEVGERLSSTEREYSDYTVELFLYRCAIGKEVPMARAVNSFAWITSEEMDEYDFTPADEDSMNVLVTERHSVD